MADEAIFVIMPFATGFDDIYNFGIKSTCAEFGFKCERADEQFFLQSILDQIYEQIASADLIIADMTGRNPNVFYEVGVAHGMKKDVILLTHSTDDIPFDLRHYPYIVYNGSISQLKNKLHKQIHHYFFESEKVPKLDDLQLVINDQPIVAESAVDLFAEVSNYGAGSFFEITFTINNLSNKVIDLKHIEFSLTCPSTVLLGENAIKRQLARRLESSISKGSILRGFFEDRRISSKGFIQSTVDFCNRVRSGGAPAPLNFSFSISNKLCQIDIPFEATFSKWRRLN